MSSSWLFLYRDQPVLGFNESQISEKLPGQIAEREKKREERIVAVKWEKVFPHASSIFFSFLFIAPNTYKECTSAVIYARNGKVNCFI